MKYIVIPDNAVDTSTHITANRALASARKELKLPMVSIKWFVPARYKAMYQLENCESFDYEQPIAGMFRSSEPETIYIQALQMDDPLQNTVYHETYHLWQYYHNKGSSMTEDFAYGYADDIEKRLAAFGDDDRVYWDHMSGKDWSEPKQQKRSKNEEKLQFGASFQAPFVKRTNTNPVATKGIKIRKTGYIEYNTAQSKQDGSGLIKKVAYGQIIAGRRSL